jgi:hypothetical protein
MVSVSTRCHLQQYLSSRHRSPIAREETIRREPRLRRLVSIPKAELGLAERRFPRSAPSTTPDDRSSHGRSGDARLMAPAR